MATINISIPQAMREEIKKLVKEGRYTSFSEVVRDGLRKVLGRKEKLTANGFTEEFEEEVLRSAAEPMENDTVLETDEDIDRYFRNLDEKIKRRHAKD